MLLVSLWLAGCEGARCLDRDSDCVPQYDPTFDAVWANTLAPSCALSGCPGGAERMPPGAPLDEVERCAIIPWIAAGAAR